MLIPFLHPEINAQQIVFIVGLEMISKRAPAIRLWPFWKNLVKGQLSLRGQMAEAIVYIFEGRLLFWIKAHTS